MANENPPALSDWYLALAEDYYKRFELNEDEEARQMNAWRGIIAGESQNLIKLLKTSNEPIHPYLRLSLIDALEGIDDKLEFKLVFQKTKRLKHKSQSTVSKARAFRKMNKIGARVAMKGGVKKGEVEAAVHEVSEEFNLSRSRVMEYWSNYKKYIHGQLVEFKWYEYLAESHGIENNLSSLVKLEEKGINYRKVAEDFRPAITDKELNLAIWLDAKDYN